MLLPKDTVSIIGSKFAGIYNKVEDAMHAMGPGFDTEYFPDPKKAAIYHQRYLKYKQLGYFLEQQISNPIVTEKSKPALQTT